MSVLMQVTEDALRTTARLTAWRTGWRNAYRSPPSVVTTRGRSPNTRRPTAPCGMIQCSSATSGRDRRRSRTSADAIAAKKNGTCSQRVGRARRLSTIAPSARSRHRAGKYP